MLYPSRHPIEVKPGAVVIFRWERPTRQRVRLFVPSNEVVVGLLGDRQEQIAAPWLAGEVTPWFYAQTIEVAVCVTDGGFAFASLEADE